MRTTPADQPVFPAGTSPVPPRRDRSGSLPAGFPPAETSYDRLPRTVTGYSWWRLALAVLIAVAVWLVGQAALLLPVVLLEAGGLFELTERMMTLDALDVPVLLVALGSLALLIPAIWFGLWVMRLRPVGLVSSVAGRLRWRWMLRCGLYAVVSLAASLGVLTGIELASGAALEPSWTPWSRLWLPLLVILVLVPFQAAAEEYAFRGILVQALASWLPRRRWARVIVVLVSTGLFVLGHAYELWGQLDVGIFALAALWTIYRTGGLEAAIALHVVNNVVVFALLASGIWGTTVQATDGGSLIGVLVSAVFTIAYCFAVEVTARRWGLTRTSPWPEVGSTTPPALALPGMAAVVGLVEPAPAPAPADPDAPAEEQRIYPPR